MKYKILIGAFLFAGHGVMGQEQETGSSMTQQLESITELNNAEPEDDAFLQQMIYYKTHPLSINTADAEELTALNVLSALQIQQFLAYRKLLGKIIDLYELQAIPSWSIDVIKKLLPFIELRDDTRLYEKLKARWTGGDKIFLLRYARVLEKSKGYDKSGNNYYLGSRDKLFTRYSYNYKNLLQWGLLAEKDAGEQFFKGSQRQGFDFYSFHFFARKLGIIRSLAIGDFTVNFAQGLIQWQSLAFKKSAAVLAVKRQSPALRPYNSAGEYNFQRGAGITLQRSNWQATLFVSYRKISANTTVDSVTGNGAASSFLTGGYHRTASEIADRNSVRQFAAGANIQYTRNNWHAGISSVHYHFSQPIRKADQPYNLFAPQGASFTNTSVDYSYTIRNIHLFGEIAADNALRSAVLAGAVVSLHTNVDASLVYRNINRGYQDVNANAFTENASPVNENGLYAAISVRPANVFRVDAYADVFKFPWLTYRTAAPSAGRDFFIQCNYIPNKLVSIYLRYKNETKEINLPGDSLATHFINPVSKKNLRLQTDIVVNRQLSVANRVETIWYNNNGPNAGQGFLTYLEAECKPSAIHGSARIRLQYFETDGYNERVYAYESDLPYGFSIPFFYDKGLRYYISINWQPAKFFIQRKRSKLAINIGLKWAQTIYYSKDVIGSGNDEINGNRQSEIKLQLILKH